MLTVFTILYLLIAIATYFACRDESPDPSWDTIDMIATALLAIAWPVGIPVYYIAYHASRDS